MSEKDKEKIENDLGTVSTPDGDLKVVNNFRVTMENREITIINLEDESLIINIKRFKESEENPYTELITDQRMRLSKLTVVLLVGCLDKANIDFNLDFVGVIAELNSKNSNEIDIPKDAK